jgi:hypothetical protein
VGAQCSVKTLRVCPVYETRSVSGSVPTRSVGTIKIQSLISITIIAMAARVLRMDINLKIVGKAILYNSGRNI